MEPVAVIHQTEQTSFCLGAMPEWNDGKRAVGCAVEQASVADIQAGIKMGRQRCVAAMADTPVGVEEVIAAITRLAAEHAVDRMEQQERIHALRIPRRFEARKDRRRSVAPQAVAIDDEEGVATEQAKGVLDAATGIEQLFFVQNGGASGEMASDLAAKIVRIDHDLAD